MDGYGRQSRGLQNRLRALRIQAPTDVKLRVESVGKRAHVLFIGRAGERGCSSTESTSSTQPRNVGVTRAQAGARSGAKTSVNRLEARSYRKPRILSRAGRYGHAR